MKNLFYKTGLDITNAKECFEFLNGHFTYDTMNSWNGLRSIANNVKIYNLNLDGDEWNALAILQDDRYCAVNLMIEEWESSHPGYKVGFNGRSDGYLVLYNDNNHSHVLPGELIDGYTYEGFKNYCKDYWGGITHYMPELRTWVQLVRDFDRLCDDIRDYVNELSKQDSLKYIVNDKLDLFNDNYYSEMKALDLPDFKLEDDNTIKISKKAAKYTSLIDCLLLTLKSSNAYTIKYEDNIIAIKE